MQHIEESHLTKKAQKEVDLEPEGEPIPEGF